LIYIFDIYCHNSIFNHFILIIIIIILFTEKDKKMKKMKKIKNELKFGLRAT